MQLFSHTGHISSAEEPHVANGYPLDDTERSGIIESSIGQHHSMLLAYARVLFPRNQRGCVLQEPLQTTLLVFRAPDLHCWGFRVFLLQPLGVITVFSNKYKHFHFPQEDCITVVFKGYSQQ